MSQNYPAVGTGQQAASGQPSYGRKYKLQVLPASGTGDVLTVTDSSFEPEALRIVFNVWTAWWKNYWRADIDIYNLSPEVVPTIINAASNITPGMTVILNAGYVNGNYDVIWYGPVFQPTFVRENVTDYKLTLHCVLGLIQATNGQIVSAVYQGYNQSEIVNAMISSLGLQLSAPVNGLKTANLWRPQVVHGDAADVLDFIAKDNNLIGFLAQRGINTEYTMASLGDNVPTQAGFVYTPTTGLIGTPQQTQNGVQFSVLLDPRIKITNPPQCIGIEQAIIQQYPLQLNDFAWPLETTGTYIAAVVRHQGDSRGNTWQTDITGLVNKGDVVNQLTAGYS